MSNLSKMAVEKQIEGSPLPMDAPIRCADCGVELGEGQPVSAAVNQRGRTWHAERLWCPACAPEPAESDADRIVEAEIGIVSIVREQRHDPTLVRVTVVEELVRADGGVVRPVMHECRRCEREVPAAELEPGKSICRDCWDVVSGEMVDALETSRERREGRR